MSGGIVAYGAYIPLYRLSLETIAHVWGGSVGRGEKAVANCDEDSLTMATEAIIDCLGSVDRESVDGLCFATTTPVYREKQNSSIIAKAVDLRRDVITLDIANSLRGGTSALKVAIDAVNSGSAKKFLVAAADCRVPAPDSTFELLFGDGAAAFLLGDSDVAVEIEGSHTISSEFMDIWRTEEDAHVQSWEERFVVSQGYLEHLEEAVSGLFTKYNITPKDFTKAVFSAYDLRRHGEIARKLGFNPTTQVQDPLLTTVGNTGTASALMMLIAALEESKPGDRILFASYGDGVDAFILRVTDQIEKLRDRRGIKKHLASKMMLPNYGKYLHFRDLMNWEVKRQWPEFASLSMSWRDRNWAISCRGQKCKQCGTIQIPMQRVCTWCQAKDEFEEVRLSSKKGTLFTYSLDHLTVITPDPPNVIAVVDLEGGGRFYTTVTDRDPEKLAPDMPVELTFRRIHDALGIHNYFWRCRPIRV
ncbi:MAG: hydroxymethylglutaryl-CoA synthase [Chloroflexota bacterium]|nr:hydroxymethylglutaryl-CoA synthase [Chloroflexota bacterium]